MKLGVRRTAAFSTLTFLSGFLAALLPIRPGDIVELSAVSSFLVFLYFLLVMNKMRYIFILLSSEDVSIANKLAFNVPILLYPIDTFLSRYHGYETGMGHLYRTSITAAASTSLIAASWVTASSILLNCDISHGSQFRNKLGVFLCTASLPLGIWLLRGKIIKAAQMRQALRSF
jgi:hypothetical protein